MASDEDKAAEYQERAQTLRENARGVPDDKTRRQPLSQADDTLQSYGLLTILTPVSILSR